MGTRRTDKVPIGRIRELYRVMKWVDERIDKGVLWWFRYVERMETVDCQDYMRPLMGGSLSVAKTTTCLKGLRGKISLFSF